MEILLLGGVVVLIYVLWKRSRGEEPTVGGAAGSCLGVGCLGIVLLFLAGLVLLWLLGAALLDADFSLSELFDSQQGQGSGNGGAGLERTD